MEMQSSPIIERYRGCLLGLAVGDALGTTREFQPPGSFAPITDMVGGGPFHLKTGQWTDDTSMALCLAESLIECRRFNPKDQMERYVRLRALEEVLGENTPVGLREKIKEDQIMRGELLWQGGSGYCVAMCSCKRSDKQNALVLRLQGTKKETFFKPSFLIPLRSLLSTDLIPESNKFGTLQRNYIREMLYEISTVFQESTSKGLDGIGDH
jgi:hypothetical protein